MFKIPIYEYFCESCGCEFEQINKVSEETWETVKQKRVHCIKCGKKKAVRIVSGFKIGSKILDTTGRSGYEDDGLTLGKIFDEGGIPYEEKSRLRNREKMIKRQKKYSKELKAREKKYNFKASEKNEIPSS